ncbi:bifunctional 23S rRNA (guanine(2069)-N(7))-methyltransferase RlmK/23S rRNA (guanine(2445)-N(2))-methyltransferase RlmL [bacterium]|nr:bifunctional 23S rRNA (guanine(2069)-N(7))-methyltransferase RlmK/23S rRNA (guanine(2445)-N(2))-methyltransferase RlmL [bacterium]
MNARTFPIHARTLSGLEGVLAEELRALGAQNIVRGNRLVTFEGDLRMLYTACLWCRTAIRILRPIAAFPAEDERTFYQHIQMIDWESWLNVRGAFAIDAHVHSSFTTHSLFLAQLAKDAIVDGYRDRTGHRPSVDLEAPDLRVVISLYRNQVQVFVDASGDSLHRRGYRTAIGQAPLKEVLAAGILRLAGWNADAPLLDPMCGSGTFCAEAAWMATNTAPGLLRPRFGFESWKDHDPILWMQLKKAAREQIQPSRVPIFGIDIDPEAIETARQNLERAGIKSAVQLEVADFFKWSGKPSVPGVMVINPPYDERLAIDNIAEFYQQMGNRLKEEYAGWRAFVLTGNLEAARYFGLRSDRKQILYNGPMECRLMEFEIREGAVLRTSEPTPIPPHWKQRAEIFSNRLRKNAKHLARWTKKELVTNWRVYDWDIPELPFVVERYGDRVHLLETPRNLDHSPIEHVQYLKLMASTAAEVLGVPTENVHVRKKRAPSRGEGFETEPPTKLVEIAEGESRFWVDIEASFDPGLDLALRKLRDSLRRECRGKDFLDLFASTATLAVAAATGGAKSTVSLETSRTRADWAKKNLALNALGAPHHRVLETDAWEFLEHNSSRFDAVVCFPRQPSSLGALENLLGMALGRLRAGGSLCFLTPYLDFEISQIARGHNRFSIQEITHQLQSPDFERKPGFRCWKFN